MNKLNQAWQLYRNFGAGWLAYRLEYALRRHSGWMRLRLPATSWDAQPLGRFLTDPGLAEPSVYLNWRRTAAPRFFFDPAQRAEYQPLFERWDGDAADPCQEADRLEKGIFRYFDAIDLPVGCPPDWQRNPFNGQSIPNNLHWSQIDDFSRGDIKSIWDLNRFGFVYLLARAYWRSGDERYPELFWQLVEDWRAHNPPQTGPNWMCGQETSLRVMAWCVGLYAFLHSPATTPQRAAALAQGIAVSGERIEFNLRHALSQQNNHGVSEGMGLWTIGLLFPELRPTANWLRKGRQVLEAAGRDLIYTDGAFAQHSANYQRLVLHDYLWAIRLGQVNERPFSAELLGRVKQAGEFLYQVQDAESGGMPCFGHNDGSLALPLNNCAYPDYRPVIQAAVCLTSGKRRYSDGPWDEDLLWLFGPQALQAPVMPHPRTDFQATQGGYYTLRSPTGFAFTHCAVYRHRPAHADTLNLDLWWRGQNITPDPGSFSYNAPLPWDYALAGGRFHNAVTVDGLDPMERISRFLWLPWMKGRATGWQRSDGGELAYWQGEHDGYQSLPSPVSVLRGILQLSEEAWLVLDRLDSRTPHTYRLQWLLPDKPYTWDAAAGALALELSGGRYQATLGASIPLAYSLVRADENSPRGWLSPCYQQRQPALSLEGSAQATSILLWTLFAPATYRISIEAGAGWVASNDWRAQFSLAPAESGWLLQSVAMSGSIIDQLEILVGTNAFLSSFDPHHSGV